MEIQIPPLYSVNLRESGDHTQQLRAPSLSGPGRLSLYEKKRKKGYVIRLDDQPELRHLILSGSAAAPDSFDSVLRFIGKHEFPNIEAVPGAPKRWERHPLLSEWITKQDEIIQRARTAVDSWQDAFTYSAEDPEKGLPGLRKPQIGAVHAVHAHWAVTDEPATIVMPTGTGKTETMLSILVSSRCQRLLVVVPTDALRTQIAEKFMTLGILKRFGILLEDAHYPVVGLLRHKPKTPDAVDAFFERCNVIVTTMSIAGQCSAEVQARMALQSPYLFIDEAHHTPAVTWIRFLDQFKHNRIVQFTATPFRNDDKPIGGKIIFNYPMLKAQEEGYFKPIHFKPVIEYDPRKADRAIAEAAVAQLREDKKKYDHILMARVESIERARNIYKLYREFEDLRVVQIHTGISSKREREEIRNQIVNGEVDVVVCVDMLGEGFDLPELKIAAFHDVRKSLTITLQLAGRFTRSVKSLGEPTFIANIGDVSVQDELYKLYTHDADWNQLLRRSSEEAIKSRVDLMEFVDGFTNLPGSIPLEYLRPRLSTVVYRTKTDQWQPENFKKGLFKETDTNKVFFDVNHQGNTMLIITARKTTIDWAMMQELYNWNWELIILYWNQRQDLLFINSSTNRGLYRKLAAAVCGDVELIREPAVFRCFEGITRLQLQNVGLKEQLGKFVSYTMRAGSDVEAGMSEAEKFTRIRANIFGTGFENGERISLGVSAKGRIWSWRADDILALTRWCTSIGRKLLNEKIDPNKVLEGTLVPRIIEGRPGEMPVYVDWPDIIAAEPEKATTFLIDEQYIPQFRTELKLNHPDRRGDLAFDLWLDEEIVATFALILSEEKGYEIVSNDPVRILRGGDDLSLTDFFNQEPPKIWFANGASLEGNLYTVLGKEIGAPYKIADIITDWGWKEAEIDIRGSESQYSFKKGIKKPPKNPKSIQYWTIKRLKDTRKYAVIFDDDGSGEAADVIGVVDNPDSITVEFYHCKYSGGDQPSNRVGDLYEVCGQAQKSIHWVPKPQDLFSHLLRRDDQRRKSKGIGRFEVGRSADIRRITEKSRDVRVNLNVYIVQPGLSKARISEPQRELLSVTENYLLETYKIPFGVIASP